MPPTEAWCEVSIFLGVNDDATNGFQQYLLCAQICHVEAPHFQEVVQGTRLLLVLLQLPAKCGTKLSIKRCEFSKHQESAKNFLRKMFPKSFGKSLSQHGFENQSEQKVLRKNGICHGWLQPYSWSVSPCKRVASQAQTNSVNNLSHHHRDVSIIQATQLKSWTASHAAYGKTWTQSGISVNYMTWEKIKIASSREVLKEFMKQTS